MRRIFLTLTFLLLASAPTLAQSPPEGFRSLFNAQDLSGWEARPHFDPGKLAAMEEPARAAKLAEWMKDAATHWTVENGELVNDGKGPYLTTKEHFSDYELLIDYKTVARADSGIYLKGTPQVQIWDYTDPGKIKRIRGTCVSCKIVSSSMAARVAYAAKGIFHKGVQHRTGRTSVTTI